MASSNKEQRGDSRQIASDLRAKIMAEELPLGSKLPSTADLMKQYSTVNQTVQNALAILKKEGFVEGRVGSGVFVRERPQQTITPEDYGKATGAGESYAWITEASRRGERGSSRLLDVSEVHAPAQVARIFGLQRGGLVVRRTQVLCLDDQPVELVHLYYPADVARGTPLADGRKMRGGSPAVLAQLGLAPVSFEDVISARPPTTEEFAALELHAEVSILHTFRVARAVDGKPVEVQVMAKAGHRYELRYRWTVA